MTELAEKFNKSIGIGIIVAALSLLLSVAVGQAAESSAHPDKGLDEQVHDIKTEVLSIAEELDRLEQRLLYPAHTQIAIFISLRKNQTFRLDSVDIEFDGKGVAYHLYSSRDVEALGMGGVQRIYTGNAAIGKHELKVTMRGRSASGDNIRIERSFPVEKNLEPMIAELMLAEGSIILIDR